MATSLKDFNEAHTSKLGNLPARIVDLLNASSQAHTAKEVTAGLLGITGRYTKILSPEIDDALPLVELALETLVDGGKIRSTLINGQYGPKTHYAKNKVHNG